MYLKIAINIINAVYKRERERDLNIRQKINERNVKLIFFINILIFILINISI